MREAAVGEVLELILKNQQEIMQALVYLLPPGHPTASSLSFQIGYTKSVIALGIPQKLLL